MAMRLSMAASGKGDGLCAISLPLLLPYPLSVYMSLHTMRRCKRPVSAQHYDIEATNEGTVRVRLC